MNTEHQAALLEMFQLYGYETLSGAVYELDRAKCEAEVIAELAAQKQARDAVPKVGDIYWNILDANDISCFKIKKIMKKTYECVLFKLKQESLTGWNVEKMTWSFEPLLDAEPIRDSKGKLADLASLTKYDGSKYLFTMNFTKN